MGATPMPLARLAGLADMRGLVVTLGRWQWAGRVSGQPQPVYGWQDCALNQVPFSGGCP
jgi:hypothetical protein